MQYRLRTLLGITGMVAIVTAAFRYNMTAGILTYLGCFLFFMSSWHFRITRRWFKSSAEIASDPWFPYVAVLFCGFAATAAAIAFCCTCSVAQIPFVRIGGGAPISREEIAFAASFQSHLWYSMLLGTAAALLVYSLCFFVSFLLRESPNPPNTTES